MKKIAMLAAAAALFAGQGAAVAGDAAAGEAAFNGKGCVGCHGPAGKSQIPTYPALNGQDAEFLSAELTKFRSGERDNPMMSPMAAGLSDDDIANISAYLAAQ